LLRHMSKIASIYTTLAATFIIKQALIMTPEQGVYPKWECEFFCLRLFGVMVHNDSGRLRKEPPALGSPTSILRGLMSDVVVKPLLLFYNLG
ncbi:MAG: hypothetical protein K2G79_03565, partial [Muribaculum sp.]|nr:hypothetical protein [Muribaculum sp.]